MPGLTETNVSPKIARLKQRIRSELWRPSSFPEHETIDTTTELGDFKSAQAALDARLSRSHALNLQLLRGQKVVAARRSLRPLLWG